MLLLLAFACARGPALEQGGPALAVAKEGDLVRFLALGDAGEGNRPQFRVGEAMAAHCLARTDALGPGCDFVAYLGDNFYPVGVGGPEDPQWETKWRAPYAALKLPFYAILGNHDYGDPPFDRDRARAQVVAAAAIEGYELPAPWYSFQAGPAHFLALDTHAVLMGWTDQEQQDFARQTLDAAAGGWRVVLAHHPFKSNGQHGNAGEYEGTGLLPFASGGRVQALYEQALCGRADLVLSGHEHNRQWLAPACGMELVVSGAGSKVTPLVGRGSATLFEDDRTRGFLWVELAPDHLRAEIVDEDGTVAFTRVLRRTPDGRLSAP